MVFFVFALFWLLLRLKQIETATIPNVRPSARFPCDSPGEGFRCDKNIARLWGQYSPAYKVPSQIPWKTPDGCSITFAQLLSRHGARYPTSGASDEYKDTIRYVQNTAKNLTGPFAFLADYKYSLGTDQLIDFGREEMVNLGIAFRERYHTLAERDDPFVRASGEDRVVESADKFLDGFLAAHDAWSQPAATSKRQSIGNVIPDDYAPVHHFLIIPETPDSNNTLSHGLCAAFEDQDHMSFLQSLDPIAARLNTLIPGANLTEAQVSDLMDLCPFTTLASPKPSVLSPFCHLFAAKEWPIYDTVKTLEKYFSYSAGNELGPTQGVGWVNELIARLTNQKVKDHTSVNHTLDSDPATFPLDRALYADFSHDNDMTSIFSAMGLYNSSNTRSSSVSATFKRSEVDVAGFKASESVPFAGRAVVEKMTCAGEEMVRVVVNGKVMPLEQCGGDTLGRCTLGRFIENLAFASQGGHWDECLKT